MEDKRFIEESFPLKEVSEESAREKNIRHGHISTIHIWWARRPLASSRATNYAALIPVPKDETERDKKRQFIIDLCKWENSNNRHLIEKARKDILEANGGKPPKVLDPFAGGGSIPLEALRLGCETYAGEYNPVANLILKCTLEYPQKYGRPKEVKRDWNYLKESMKNPLVEDVKMWGNWVLEETKREIDKFYPTDADGSIPVGYIWARTIPCQNPTCHGEIPLMKQFWLAKKDKKKIALKPITEGNEVKFEIIENPKFDPSKGTVKGAVAHCLLCGAIVDEKRVRKLFQEDKAGHRMVAVVVNHPKKRGKIYRIPLGEDIKIFNDADDFFVENKKKIIEETGIDPIPNEYLNPENPDQELYGTRCIKYNIKKFEDFFNSRQKLALMTFGEKIKEAYKEILKVETEKNYTKTLITYLAFIFDRLASFSTILCRWKSGTEQNIPVFSGRNSIPIVFDYFEVNTTGKISTGWLNCQTTVLESFKNLENNLFPAYVSQNSATNLDYSDNYFDAVFTDPPYYDNINYAELSDFFYVWLKRIIGDLYPELFSTPIISKSKEIVANPIRHGGQKSAKIFFEENLKKAFQEIHRVLKPNGIATIVYTHRSTSGWETLINSLLDSGFIVTSSWPIDTEMKSRLTAKESAALASSIYIIARKIPKRGKGWFKEVKEEIKKHLNERLERLWQEGISGADFLIAGIGSAIEIFGKYEKVLDYEGNVIRADKLLEFVRDVVTDYAVRQILHNGIAGELSPLAKFYILWRWTYKDAKAPFDDARKLAQSSGLDISREWNKGFVKKDKEFIKVLGPQDRSFKDEKIPKELIDTLHHAVNLWKEGKRKQMNKILQESGWGTKDSLYRVAQAISSTMPQESKEKKLLDGFLSGKKQILSEVSKGKQKQLDLFIKKESE